MQRISPPAAHRMSGGVLLICSGEVVEDIEERLYIDLGE